MRLTTQSEYALICLKALCQVALGRPLSIHEIAERESMSKDYIEQLFLKLRKADIVRSVKGVHGGYVLAKDPSLITLKEVIEALEGDIYEVFCSPEVRQKIVCMHFEHCSLRPVWLKLKQMIDDFFGHLTLDMLLKDEESMRKGLQIEYSLASIR